MKCDVFGLIYFLKVAATCGGLAASYCASGKALPQAQIIGHVPRRQIEWRRSPVVETGASLCRDGGDCSARSSQAFAVHTRQNAASDFKTLYASAWCFVRGIDAYSFPNLGKVFEANGIVVPQSWYAHAPVYPPVTLALLAPLTLLPMDVAVYFWLS